MKMADENQLSDSKTTSPEAEAAAGTASSATEASASVAPTLHQEGSETHGEEPDFAHPLPMKALLGVLGALLVLTVLTVAVTQIDLGSQGNLIVAMIIATIKAVLVMGVFMHLLWDSKFNVLIFLSSFLFVALFLAMAILDRQEYQEDIDEFVQTQAQQN